MTGLRRGTRITITIWVLAVTAALATYVGYLLWHLPQLISTAAAAIVAHGMAAHAALAGHHVTDAAVASVSLVLLVLPFIGLTYVLSRLVSRLVRHLAARIRPGRQQKRRPASSGWAVGDLRNSQQSERPPAPNY